MHTMKTKYFNLDQFYSTFLTAWPRETWETLTFVAPNILHTLSMLTAGFL